MSYLFLEVEEVVGLIDKEHFQRATPQIVPPKVDLSQLRQGQLKIFSCKINKQIFTVEFENIC